MTCKKCVSIQPSTEKDAMLLAKNMRKQDIMECEANNTDPLSALLYPLKQITHKHLHFCMEKSQF